jgi:hypothetical protein
MRQLRGAILRAMLSRPKLSIAELEHAVAAIPGAGRPGAVVEALAALRCEGLLTT